MGYKCGTGTDSLIDQSQIQDIPSIRELLAQAKTMQHLKRAVPIFRPILKLLRVDGGAMEAILVGADDLAARAHALAQLPDRFNRIFAERGWIVYDALNLDVAFAAVEKAEAGNVDGAEADLVTYYDEATINFNLMMFNGVRAFRSRLPLARKALADYVAGRYHACVPVVLALLDGMVNELGGHGFFAQGVDLRAWDSVAGHSKGLAALAKILGASRTKTTTEPMAIPCRNGIHARHGSRVRQPDGGGEGMGGVVRGTRLGGEEGAERDRGAGTAAARIAAGTLRADRGQRRFEKAIGRVAAPWTRAWARYPSIRPPGRV